MKTEMPLLRLDNRTNHITIRNVHTHTQSSMVSKAYNPALINHKGFSKATAIRAG